MYVRCLMPVVKLPACCPKIVSPVNEEELQGIMSCNPDAGASKSLQTRVILFTGYNAQALELASHPSGPSGQQAGTISLSAHLPMLWAAAAIQLGWAELSIPQTQLCMWATAFIHGNIWTSLEMTFWWWKTRNDCLEEEWHLKGKKKKIF